MQWSPSRASGRFLLYYELANVFESNTGPVRASAYEITSLARGRAGAFRVRPDGLIKKTISMTIDGDRMHLISYFKARDVMDNRLPGPADNVQLWLSGPADNVQRVAVGRHNREVCTPTLQSPFPKSVSERIPPFSALVNDAHRPTGPCKAPDQYQPLPPLRNTAASVMSIQNLLAKPVDD